MLGAEFANVDGHRIYYQVSGSGSPAVVLVHGWTCDSSFWGKQAPELAKHFQVLAVDLLGHGRSDKPETEYDLKTLARSVEGVMRAAKIERAVLVGHSMGTPVIRQVLEDSPGKVQGLISVDGAVFRSPSEKFSEDFRAFAASMAGADGKAARAKFISSMFTEATSPALREAILEKMLAAPPYVASSAMKAAVLSDIWQKPATNVPVLAINQTVKNDRSKLLHREVFTNLDFRELEGVSHFLMMEKPDEVNRLMIDFVKKAGR